MAVIEVRDLVRDRGGASLAVNGVSFDVEEGSVFGLLGPNGAGKTSTVEVLECLDPPTGGSVRVFGHDVRTHAPAIKRRIGVQLQLTGLPRFLSVMETLELFSSFYPSHTRGVEEIVNLLGLTQLKSTINTRLSGGERQRVALALALVNDPDVLFLDEPSAGLDVHARRELWGIIRRWQHSGKTVVLCTHDMHEAESLCDEIAIMHEGRIAAKGTVVELVGPRDQQAISVQADGLPLPGDLHLRVPAVYRSVPEPDGALLLTSDAAATMAGLLELRRNGGLSFESCRVRRPTLEDTFVELTGRRLDG